jgi:hypothetical protein
LTRWERRAQITFGLDEGSSDDFGQQVDEPISTINITITNLGARAVHLNLRTLEVESNDNVCAAWRQDHFGGVQREIVLKPNDTETIGLPLDTFRSELKIEDPVRYDEHSFNFMQPLKVSIASTSGKVFSSKGLKFWEATGEFHRA